MLFLETSYCVFTCLLEGSGRGACQGWGQQPQASILLPLLPGTRHFSLPPGQGFCRLHAWGPLGLGPQGLASALGVFSGLGAEWFSCHSGGAALCGGAILAPRAGVCPVGAEAQNPPQPLCPQPGPRTRVHRPIHTGASWRGVVLLHHATLSWGGTHPQGHQDPSLLQSGVSLMPAVDLRRKG